MNDDLRAIERRDWLYHCRKLVADQSEVVRRWQGLADAEPSIEAYTVQVSIERDILQDYKQQYDEARRGF